MSSVHCNTQLGYIAKHNGGTLQNLTRVYHTVFSTGVAFTSIEGIYFWMLKITGSTYPEFIGIALFLMFLVST